MPIAAAPQEHFWPAYPAPASASSATTVPMDLYDQYMNQQAAMRITPSMISLEALLSKLPSVGTATSSVHTSLPLGYYEMSMMFPMSAAGHGQMPQVAKEMDPEEYGSSSMSYYVNGTLWFQFGHHVQDQVGLLFFIPGFFCVFFPVFQAILTFPKERMMLTKERSSKMYRLSSYFMARLVGDLPMELILPTVFITIHVLDERPETEGE